MIGGRLGKAFVATAVLFPSITLATPINAIAKWLEPWQVVFNPILTDKVDGATAFALPDFGLLGDGEDLPGVHAAAFSIARTEAATFGGASATTGVTFT